MIPMDTPVFINTGDHRGEYGRIRSTPLSSKSELHVVQLRSGRGILIDATHLEPVTEEEIENARIPCP